MSLYTSIRKQVVLATRDFISLGEALDNLIAAAKGRVPEWGPDFRKRDIAKARSVLSRMVLEERAKVAKLERRIAQLEKKPTAKDIVDTLNWIQGFGYTPGSQADRYVSIIRAALTKKD